MTQSAYQILLISLMKKAPSQTLIFRVKWLNLKFTPPETVVMNTEEELQSVMKQGQTTLEESSGVELGDDALSGTVYEMMASSISGFPNVSLVVEDASLENMTVDQYFLAAQQMLDATGMGYTYSDVTDIQIARQDFRVMETSVAVNDYEVLQKYCTRKTGRKVCLHYFIIHHRYHSRSR